jgi:TonB family protein
MRVVERAPVLAGGGELSFCAAKIAAGELNSVAMNNTIRQKIIPMRKSLLVLCVLGFAATCAADTFEIPRLSQPFSVRVMLMKPASQFRGPNMALPTKQSTPEFPLRMRGVAIDEVIVSLTVEADGSVSKIKILKHSQPEFDESVLEAVKTWRFTPAKEGGKAVAMTLEYGVRFDLPNEP